jgi:hypothetical protein
LVGFDFSKKIMVDKLGFDQLLAESNLPQPGYNRGYSPEQLLE